MAKNENNNKATSKKPIEKIELEITGEPKKDFATFNKSKDYNYGVKLVEFYAPKNKNLIGYFKATSDMKYLKYNLKIIIDARS